ncbi:MAG: hypothetical protein IPG45_34915 [Deltaproteobacteria bacterium]|jgi:hypothetical protein|nr:hypothetical protein [Deltaproteobacteria bacterium]
MVAAHTEAPQLPGLSARERVALLRILAVSSIDDATIEPRRAAALENYARVLVSGPADHRAVVVAAQRLIAVWAPARPAPVVVRSTHAPAPSSQVHPKLMRAEAALAEEPKRRPIFAAFLEVAESGATEPMSPYHLAAVCAAHARPQSRALPRAVSGR